MDLEILKANYPLRIELRYKQEELQDINSRLYSLQGIQNKENVDSTPPLADEQLVEMIDKKMVLERDIEALNYLIESNIKKMEEMFEKLEPVPKAIFRYRYILCMKWEDVAEKIDFSERHIRRVHCKILKSTRN